MDPKASRLVNLLLSCPSPIHEEQDEAILNGILNGECKLVEIKSEIGNAVLTYEIQGDIFVIIALHFINKNSPASLLPKILLSCETLAKNNNCKQLKFHTFRPGLVKQTLEMGFMPCEYIMRKKI